MTFKERFEQLCAENGKTPTAVGTELGFAKSAISRWRNSTAKPSYKTINALAEYFGVSADYLLGNTEIRNSVNNQSPDDIAKVALFGGDREVTEEMWNEVKDYVEYIKQKHFKP